MPLSVALALALAAGDAGVIAARFDVPGARGPAVPMETVIDASGHPQHAWASFSKERIDTLARHFAREMTRAGLFVAPAREQVQFPGAFQVTGIDAKTGVAHTVLVFPDKQGAQVVQAQTELKVSAEQQAVPLPKGARQLGAFSSEGWTTVLFEVAGEEKAVRRFFDAELDSGAAELTLVAGQGGLLRGALRVLAR